MSDKATELSDSISKMTHQVTSLLAVASSDDFHDFSTEIKTGYLWACSELSESIRDEFDAYDRITRGGEDPTSSDT